MANNEKKSLPLVSIIIDNYNYGRFIQDAIESTLNQTYPNIEVIVVDDGSTDSSREIISRYASAGRVKAVLKENGGLASAMNAGFEVSSGDLVVFLDSDDVLKPEAIEDAVRAWHPGVSKVQWRLEAIDGEGNSMGLFFPPLNAHLLNGNVRQIVKRWFYFGASPQSGNMYSRDFLEVAMPLP
jgi:glycosyltransferase involved in cell wall biosynthesis